MDGVTDVHMTRSFKNLSKIKRKEWVPGV